MSEKRAWLNGNLVPESTVELNYHDHYYLFETMLAIDSRIIRLPQHIARLHSGIAHFHVAPPTVDYQQFLSQLLTANGHQRDLARIRLFVAWDERSSGKTASVFAFSYRYQQPRDAYANGWNLKTLPHSSASELARYKVMNFHHSRLHLPDVADAGYDDAIIFDPSGHIAEATRASLLIKHSGSWHEPESANKLPGTTYDALVSIFADLGMPISKRPFTIDDIADIEAMFTTSSLTGVIPIRSIDRIDLPQLPVALGAQLRTALYR